MTSTIKHYLKLHAWHYDTAHHRRCDICGIYQVRELKIYSYIQFLSINRWQTPGWCYMGDRVGPWIGMEEEEYYIQLVLTDRVKKRTRQAERLAYLEEKNAIWRIRKGDFSQLEGD